MLIEVLWATAAIGLYALIATAVLDLVRERKVGTACVVQPRHLAGDGGRWDRGRRGADGANILIAKFIAERSRGIVAAAPLGWIGPIPAAIIPRRSDMRRFVNCVKLRRVRLQGI